MTRGVGFCLCATVVALVLAAPASAAHVSCGDAITADTTLDSDIVCSDEDPVGLGIQASNVTLRLAGHYIFGSPGEVGDVGVFAGSEYDGITIRGAGGGIQGFQSQVSLNGDDSTVRRTNIEIAQCDSVAFGIQLPAAGGYAYRNVVEVPDCWEVGTTGIELGEEGYAWGNQLGGGDNGIVALGDKTRVIGNTVSFCAAVGIRMFGYPTGAWASYNSVSGCTVGIHGSANDDGSGHDGSGRYGHNTLTDNTHGLVVDDGSAIVARNTADGNDHTGIFTSVAGVRVQNNTANANGVYGIDAAAGTVDGGGNTATGNGTANCVNVSCP